MLTVETQHGTEVMTFRELQTSVDVSKQQERDIRSGHKIEIETFLGTIEVSKKGT